MPISPARSHGYRGLLGNAEYLGLLSALVVSVVGDQLARVALTVLVFSRTGSPFLSAIAYAVTFLPVVLGGPLLGGLADRLPRRDLLVVADLGRAALFVLMAWPGLPLTALLVMVLVATTAEAPFSAARAPLMRAVLSEDEQYQLGTAVDETVQQTGQVLGFMFAGGLLTVLSPSAVLVLDGLTFVGSAVLVRSLVGSRVAAEQPAGAAGGRVRRLGRARLALADARVGVLAALAPACRRPLLLTWAGLSFAIAPEALATAWADDLGVGRAGTGLLFAVGPAGAVAGLLVVGRASAAVAARLLVPLALLSVLPLALSLLHPAFPWVMLLVFLSGSGSSYSLLARVAFVRGVDDTRRGRAFSVAAAGLLTGQGVGIAGAGAAAAVVGPPTAVGLVGLFGAVAVCGVGVLTRASSGMRSVAVTHDGTS